MKKLNKLYDIDIGDDEIRIIRPKTPPNVRPGRRKRRLLIAFGTLAAVVAIICGIVLIVGKVNSPPAVNDDKETPDSYTVANTTRNSGSASRHGFVNVTDTVVNDKGFTILTPVDAVPSLHIGADILNDTTAVLVAQAADFRADNGDIAGTFVYKGNLIAKGEAKPGFCAIINGELTVGVSDTSPMLEEAIATDGYFFRQYPLVVGGQIVENKPKTKSLRKALTTIDGKPVIILSHDRMTLHDFSQSLVDLGVPNAIYLVGSNAYGFARKENGETITFGERVKNMPPKANYIVWR